MRGFILSATEREQTLSVGDVAIADAGDGDVVIDVEYSAMNFKDWLVAQPNSRVRRTDRLVLGVEAAGRVLESRDERFAVGDEVIAYGSIIGVGRDGGFAERMVVPARYVTKLPSSHVFHSREAMIYGLAGYTAMASILDLEQNGLTVDDGEVLVTGATGGVGSLAVALLARRGYRVVASTGSAEHREWLHLLGATRVIGREEIADRPERVLAQEQWAGAIDCVGGTTLHQILRSLRYGAAVAASGLVGGSELESNVYPFVTRNVRLLGIDAVESSVATRERVWRHISESRSGADEQLVERELALNEIPMGLDAMRDGSTRGRWLVRP